MMRYYILTVFCLVSISASAQLGGRHVYEFLSLDPSARVTALGGNLITVQDADVSLAYMNPAALNEEMLRNLSFNTEVYFAGTDIFHGYAGYAYKVGKVDLLMHSGIQMISYGGFDKRDIYANDQGTFTASEYALTTGTSRQLTDKINLGINFKFIISQLETYNSLGFAGDVAAMYQDTAKQMTATFVVKNLGAQFTTYQGQQEDLPFEIQLGFSKRLKHLPLRFSIIATNLQRWDIRYNDPNAKQGTTLLGEAVDAKSDTQIFVDNFFRHFIFNGEFLLGRKENFRLRVGYNHLRRAELSLTDLRSMAGFSLGTGFKIKRFKIDYGVAFYHLGAATHHFGISTKL